MFQKLFEIPLLGDLPTSWAVFIVLVVALAALITWGSKIRADGEEKEEDSDALKAVKKKKRLVGQLLVILPTAAFVTAFLTYVQTPFGKLPINSYGFAIMVGFLLACWIGVKRAKPLGIDSDFILDVGIISMIAGILGAKLNYLVQYPEQAGYLPPENSDLKTLFGDMGMNPLGGLVLGPIPFAIWWWRTQTDPRKIRLYSWQTAVLLGLTLLFALIGTRALYIIQNKAEYQLAMFENWQSGFVLYGGLGAGVGAGVLYVLMRGQSLFRIADLTAPLVMLGIAFGRLGCFLNGCCFGKVCEGFPGITFPKGSAAYSVHLEDQLITSAAEASKPVHPTQLYETAVCIGFFFLLSWMWKKKRKVEGELLLYAAMLYGTWRFIVEFMRGDDRPLWIEDPDLSYSQAVGVLAIGAAAILLFLLRKYSARKSLEAPPPAPPPAEPAPEPKA